MQKIHPPSKGGFFNANYGSELCQLVNWQSLSPLGKRKRGSGLSLLGKRKRGSVLLLSVVSKTLGYGEAFVMQIFVPNFEAVHQSVIRTNRIR